MVVRNFLRHHLELTFSLGGALPMLHGVPERAKSKNTFSIKTIMEFYKIISSKFKVLHKPMHILNGECTCLVTSQPGRCSFSPFFHSKQHKLSQPVIWMTYVPLFVCKSSKTDWWESVLEYETASIRLHCTDSVFDYQKC